MGVLRLRHALSLANAVSLSRVALLPLWIGLHSARSPWAMAVATLIALSDVVDGPIARRHRTAGPIGQTVDVACDAVVLFGAALYVSLGDIRFLVLAALMATSFATWAAIGARARGLSYTRVGRYCGAACYALMLIVSAVLRLPAGIGGALVWMGLCAAALVLGASAIGNLRRILRPCALP